MPVIPHNVGVHWNENGVLIIPFDEEGKAGKPWFLPHELADQMVQLMVEQHDKLFVKDATTAPPQPGANRPDTFI